MKKEVIIGIFVILIFSILVFANSEVININQDTSNKPEQIIPTTIKDIMEKINTPIIKGGGAGVEDLIVNNKFNHLKGFKQIEFTIEQNNIAVDSFNKETLTSSKTNLKNKFTSDSVEVETLYEEVDTSFFNVDERPVKQTYILKNLQNNNKDIKLNIMYEIDSDFVTWNSTEYAITNEPIYFKAFEVTEEIFPGLNETHLTGHTLYFGNNYYDFKDVVDLDYVVSVYSLGGKNYIGLEISSEVKGLEEFVVDPVIGWTDHVIDDSGSWDWPMEVFAIDIDDDNDIDVLSASSEDNKIEWYENNGSSPPGWTTHTITTSARCAHSVYAIDVDNDNDIDVLSASWYDNKIAWYENNGSSPPGWTTHNITTSADDARDVFAIDIDNDNDIDVLSASADDDKIAWYENNGSSPPGWTSHNITTSADYAMSVFAIDIDNDNDIDVLSASRDDDKVAWYENNGSSPPGWTTHNITTSANGSNSVYAIDVDNDNDIDVLSASFYGSSMPLPLYDAIVWYENDGSSPPSWTPHNITTYATDPNSIFAIDIDNDNDIDVLSAAYANTIAWYENDGGSPPSLTYHTITHSAETASSVYAIDVDNDNDIDVLSTSIYDNKVAWYESDLSPNLTIQEIIPIQVIENVDLVKGKTTLVRAVVKNNATTSKDVIVKLYFEGSLKDTETETINSGQEKNIDLWFIPDVAGSNKEIKVVVDDI